MERKITKKKTSVIGEILVQQTWQESWRQTKMAKYQGWRVRILSKTGWTPRPTGTDKSPRSKPSGEEDLEPDSSLVKERVTVPLPLLLVKKSRDISFPLINMKPFLFSCLLFMKDQLDHLQGLARKHLLNDTSPTSNVGRFYEKRKNPVDKCRQPVKKTAMLGMMHHERQGEVRVATTIQQTCWFSV